MATHSAHAIFRKNIQSADNCISLYDAIVTLKPKGVDIEWVLRAAVVFIISSLDRYFHDKVKYRVGKYNLSTLPSALAKFRITIEDISDWERSKRKGNVIRNWVDKHLSTKPLQSQSAITEALQLADINAFWDTLESDKNKQRIMLKKLGSIIRRRNQISHEGDRQTSRSSGKSLRKIDRNEVADWEQFISDFVQSIEHAFPA